MKVDEYLSRDLCYLSVSNGEYDIDFKVEYINEVIKSITLSSLNEYYWYTLIQKSSVILFKCYNTTRKKFSIKFDKNLDYDIIEDLDYSEYNFEYDLNTKTLIFCKNKVKKEPIAVKVIEKPIVLKVKEEKKNEVIKETPIEDVQIVVEKPEELSPKTEVKVVKDYNDRHLDCEAFSPESNWYYKKEMSREITSIFEYITDKIPYNDDNFVEIAKFCDLYFNSNRYNICHLKLDETYCFIDGVYYRFDKIKFYENSYLATIKEKHQSFILRYNFISELIVKKDEIAGKIIQNKGILTGINNDYHMNMILPLFPENLYVSFYKDVIVWNSKVLSYKYLKIDIHGCIVKGLPKKINHLMIDCTDENKLKEILFEFQNTEILFLQFRKVNFDSNFILEFLKNNSIKEIQFYYNELKDLIEIKQYCLDNKITLRNYVNK